MCVVLAKGQVWADCTVTKPPVEAVFNISFWVKVKAYFKKGYQIPNIIKTIIIYSYEFEFPMRLFSVQV